MLKFNVVIELIWTLESLSTELTGRGNVLIPVRPQMANVFALVPVTGYLREKKNIYISVGAIHYLLHITFPGFVYRERLPAGAAHLLLVRQPGLQNGLDRFGNVAELYNAFHLRLHDVSGWQVLVFVAKH